MSRRQRIPTAVVLAPLPILAVLFLPTPWLAAIVALVLLAGLWEWTHFAGVHERLPRAAFLTANALLMAALVWGGGPSLFTLKLMSLVGVLWWALVCLWLARPAFGKADTAANRSLKLLAGTLGIIPAWCALGWLHSEDPYGARWTLFALLNAEEAGITSANVEKQAASSTNPDVRRLLGADGDYGKDLKVSKDWVFNMVKQVGNYGEIFERNVGTGSELKIARGQNALWNAGGLQYAPPVR